MSALMPLNMLHTPKTLAAVLAGQGLGFLLALAILAGSGGRRAESRAHVRRLALNGLVNGHHPGAKSGHKGRLGRWELGVTVHTEVGGQGGEEGIW